MSKIIKNIELARCDIKDCNTESFQKVMQSCALCDIDICTNHSKAFYLSLNNDHLHFSLCPVCTEKVKNDFQSKRIDILSYFLKFFR